MSAWVPAIVSILLFLLIAGAWNLGFRDGLRLSELTPRKHARPAKKVKR